MSNRSPHNFLNWLSNLFPETVFQAVSNAVVSEAGPFAYDTDGTLLAQEMKRRLLISEDDPTGASAIALNELVKAERAGGITLTEFLNAFPEHGYVDDLAAMANATNGLETQLSHLLVMAGNTAVAGGLADIGELLNSMTIQGLYKLMVDPAVSDTIALTDNTKTAVTKSATQLSNVRVKSIMISALTSMAAGMTLSVYSGTTEVFKFVIGKTADTPFQSVWTIPDIRVAGDLYIKQSGTGTISWNVVYGAL